MPRKAYSKKRIDAKLDKLKKELFASFTDLGDKKTGKKRENTLSDIVQNLENLYDDLSSNIQDQQKLFGDGTFRSFRKSIVGKMVTEERQKAILLNAKAMGKGGYAGQDLGRLKPGERFKLGILGGNFGGETPLQRLRRRQTQRALGIPEQVNSNAKPGSASGSSWLPMLGGALLGGGVAGGMAGATRAAEEAAQSNPNSPVSGGGQQNPSPSPIQVPSTPTQPNTPTTPSPSQPLQGPGSSPSPRPSQPAAPLSVPTPQRYPDLAGIGTIAARNINPGNVTANSDHDYMGQTGGERVKKNYYASFATKEAGVAAIVNRLFRFNGPKTGPKDKNGGHKTIEEIIHIYAPKNENNTEQYINDVVNMTGIPRDQPLDFRKNPELIDAFVPVIMQIEDGQSRKQYTQDEINRGIQIGKDEAFQGRAKAMELHGQYLNGNGPSSPPAQPSQTPNQPSQTPTSPLNQEQPTRARTDPSYVSPLSDLNKRMYEETKRSRLQWRNGSKGENGLIDCSGWVQMAMKKAGVSPDILNLIYGKTSEDQILNVATATGARQDTKTLSPGELREGMLIGVKNNSSRSSKIGHIGVVLRNPDTNELGVSHAAKSRGVHWQPLSGFQRDFGSDGFVLVDPFLNKRDMLLPFDLNRDDDLSFRQYAKERGIVFDPLQPDLGLGPEVYAQLHKDYDDWFRVRSKQNPANDPSRSEPLQPTPGPKRDPNHPYLRPEDPTTDPGWHIPGQKAEPLKPEQVPDRRYAPQANYPPASPAVQEENRRRGPNGPYIAPNNWKPGVKQAGYPVNPGGTGEPVVKGSIPDKKSPWTNLYEGVSDATRSLFQEMSEIFGG